MPYLYLPIKKYIKFKSEKTSLMCFVAIIIIAWITCFSTYRAAVPELITRVHKL